MKQKKLFSENCGIIYVKKNKFDDGTTNKRFFHWKALYSLILYFECFFTLDSA